MLEYQIMSIKENVRCILEQIKQVSSQVSASSKPVTLVAVTKMATVEQIKELVKVGHNICGENRAQDLRDKAKALADLNIRWHFIGTLQTNKIKYVYNTVELVHSIDREELLEEFKKWAQKTGRKCPCLLEVHISHEPTKHGFDKDEVLKIIEKYRNDPALEIKGLMGMAPFVSDENVIRNSFRTLKYLFDESKKLEGDAYKAIELSMGMTDDYHIAIQEGATIVRIGRAIFGG